MAKFTVRQGEADLLPFRIKDKKTGRPRNLTGAAFTLWVKRTDDDEPIIVKADADFDKGGVENGYVTVFVEARDTVKTPGLYDGELRIVTADNPPKILKPTFDFEIEAATTPNDWVLQPAGIASLEAFGDAVVMNI